MPVASPRARARLLLTVAVLIALGLLAVNPVRQPGVKLAAVADQAVPAQGERAAPTTTTIASTTTSMATASIPSTVTPTTQRVKAPLVIAKKPVNDLPVGTPLRGPVELRGVVRDTAGSPVAGACVVVRASNSSAPGPAIEATTGTDGVFAGGYDLYASSDYADIAVSDCSGAAAAFVRQFLHVWTTPGATIDVPVTVERSGSTLNGTLLDDDHKPVPSACVYVSHPDIITFGVLTDLQGGFKATGLPLGQYGLSVRTTSNGKCDWGLFLPSAEQASLTITLFQKNDASPSQFATDTVTTPRSALTNKVWVR